MKNKKLIIILLIIACVIVIFFHHTHKHTTISAAEPTILVRTEKPLIKSIPKTTTTTGDLVAIQSTIITPRASGYIKSIAVHEGENVKKGQTLFQLNDQAEKDALIAAKANYSLCLLKFEQEKKLLPKGYITKDTFDAAKVALKQNQAALQAAEKNLALRTITAPFNGTVGALSLSIGDYVQPTNTLTTFVNTKQLRAEYALPSKDLNQLQLQQPVSISAAGDKENVTALVSYISPSIDQTSQTVDVHAHVNNSANLFKPGEYVVITQNLGVTKNALLIPEQSILPTINGYSVFIVKHNKAVRVPVKVGDYMNGKAAILAGIKPSDQIIIAGQNQVKNGELVSVVRDQGSVNT